MFHVALGYYNPFENLLKQAEDGSTDLSEGALLRQACQTYLNWAAPGPLLMLTGFVFPTANAFAFFRGEDHRTQVQRWLDNSTSLTTANVNAYRRTHNVVAGGDFDQTVLAMTKALEKPSLSLKKEL